jgi:signal peptidase I
VGKVFMLVWPTDRFGWIGTPDAFDDVPDPE